MHTLVDTCVRSLPNELVLLAPPNSRIPRVFRNVQADGFLHEQLLHRMQVLRGAVYLEEGNIDSRQLTRDGRHKTPEDERAWHLLMVGRSGEVRSCALYLLHEGCVTLRDLRIRKCPLVEHAVWGPKLKAAIASEIARAREANIGYAELGGWAIHRSRRGTPEGLMMALATYGLATLLGGALGITTANVAHSCSKILQRLGGSPLEAGGERIPAYFDHRYNTDIDLLKFDSRSPQTRYANLVAAAQETVASVLVMTAATETRALPSTSTISLLGYDAVAVA